MGKMSKAQIDKSLAALKDDIAAAVESATTMREKVQHALVACVSHWKLTGSNAGLADIVNKFLSELGQGVNLKAVKEWCERHLHMQEHADGKKLVFKPVKASDLDTKAASDQKWWTLKQQQVFSFDLIADITKLASKIAKAEAELKKDANADVKGLTPELVTGVKELAALVKA